MRYFFGLLLLCPLVLWAQGDDVGCSMSVSREDRDCSPASTETCEWDSGYQVRQFSPNCDGIHYIDAWTACSVNNCVHCAACVRIWDVTTQTEATVVGTFSVCDLPSPKCAVVAQVSLTASHTYELWVKLVSCAGDVTNCDGCGSDCTAYGRVYR